MRRCAVMITGMAAAAYICCGCGMENGTFVFQLNGEAKMEKESQPETVKQAETIAYVPDGQITNPPLYDASDSRVPLFRDVDGTIHGPQIGTSENGTPVYDYDIQESLERVPQGWLDYTYPGRKQSYLSPSGVWLFMDMDGTIHGPQIGTTELGTPMFDYEIDTSEIPPEWQR